MTPPLSEASTWCPMKPILHVVARLFVTSAVVLAGADPAAAQPPKPRDGPLGMKFVPLPKGSFYMGWHGDKGSGRKTEIKEDFEIAIYTVTQKQWQDLMGNNPSYFARQGALKDRVKDVKDEDLQHFPVEMVSWNDVQGFLKKLNEAEMGKGYRYRLPTEAEWEYACRGGATTEQECSYHFYFDKPTNDLSSTQANFHGKEPAGKGKKGPVLGRTTKVGSYAPNPLGLYDMHGNVWQWTDTAQGTTRISRGGAWHDIGVMCQAWHPNPQDPTQQYPGLGFRVVRTPVR